VNLALFTYSLLSGRRRDARRTLAQAPLQGGVKAALWLASWLPMALVQLLFTLYRRRQVPDVHAH
jgi:hypothetical protein